MSLSSIASSDTKIGKNGHKYPAKRITLGVSKPVNEASYRGNIGVMELAKFHSTASDDDKKKFVDLMKKKKEAKSEEHEKQMASQIWDHVQKVTGTKLHQMESKQMRTLKDLLESKEDFILQTLADKDINASVKDGKIHIHDHSQHRKAQTIVKRLGMPHEVVKAPLKEDTVNEEHKIGDRVHIGMGQKGGAGVIGRLKSIDGNWAHVESEHEETGLGGKKFKPVWKGLVKHMSKMDESVDEYDEDTHQTVQEAMPTHHFNKMVRGYLAHKKAAKVGNFKPMSVDQFKARYNKVHGVVEEEVLDELSTDTLKKYQDKAMGDARVKKATQRTQGVLRAGFKLQDKNVNESDKIDTVTFDVPLLIRALEYAREEVKSDAELHSFVEKMIASAKAGTLTMDDYKKLTEEKKLIVPTLKPRDPNHAVLMAKKNAGGFHKDRKKELKNGGGKHRDRVYEELNSEKE